MALNFVYSHRAGDAQSTPFGGRVYDVYIYQPPMPTMMRDSKSMSHGSGGSGDEDDQDQLEGGHDEENDEEEVDA